MKINREQAHNKANSRDCSCIKGIDRDTNYHETIDEVYDSFESQTCASCSELSTCKTREILFNEQNNFDPKLFGCNQHKST